MDWLGLSEIGGATFAATLAKAQLEELIRARTEELEASNAELERQVCERRQAEESLRMAHAQMADIVNAISSILISMDANGRVTVWNPAAGRTLGVAPEQAVGRLLVDCPVDWELRRVGDAVEACRARGATQRLDDLHYTRPDGHRALLGITINAFSDQEGRRRGLLLLAADTTERRMLTSQLAQAQKLESIGQLAAGIAHEINTPIQYVGDNLRFLQDCSNRVVATLSAVTEALRELRDGSSNPFLALEALRALDLESLGPELGEIPMAIADALDGTKRVSEIVRAMREFSHPALAEKIAIDVNRAIQSTITVSRNEWKRVAEMRTDLDPDVPLVPCLPGELNQVILNILINAVHAIRDVVGDGRKRKGVIAVSTRAAAGWVEIRISDTGTGIPADIRDRVFDPFFTTKEVGQGTGQGLALAHSVIVEKHGGTITFDTECGAGTTFTIRLPIECDAVPRGTTV